MKKTPRQHTLRLDKIVGGGQALGTLNDGRKAFVWGGLPGEAVTIRETKRKSNYVEGIVVEFVDRSKERIEPLDPDSYLSTSPWQIMTFEAEQRYKSSLIDEAFELHGIALPNEIEVYSDNHIVNYRNKVEFSWYGQVDATGSAETLDLAFFRRGSKGKIVINSMSLLPEPMMQLAREIRDFLSSRSVTARQLKTLLIRCDQANNCVWQLYVKDEDFDALSAQDAASFGAQGGEVIYSDPRIPASRITQRLLSVGDIVLSDTILGVPFRYATEGFFQVNIPVYEEALRDMQSESSREVVSSEPHLQPESVPMDARERPGAKPSDEEMTSDEEGGAASHPVIDLYSGVGSIGLTIGGDNCTLIEIDENAVREMKRNITELGSKAHAVLAPAEKALSYINGNSIVIVDPPRAGMHADVVAKLIEAQPPRIIYLSCNPVTQARDVSLLSEEYRIVYHRGYNFFPRTPHIEHLVVLDKR